MPFNDCADFTPQEAFEVVFRGCGCCVDLSLREALVKPRGDSGCCVSLTRRVCRLCNGDCIVADGFKQALYIIGKGFAEHVLPEADRVVLVLSQVALLPESGVNRIEQEIEELVAAVSDS